MATGEIKQSVMMAARSMVQARGYNSLSFTDLATTVGVESSDIKDYFPTKGDLGAAIAREYTDELLDFLHQALETSDDRKSCIRSYTEGFRTTLVRENRMSLGGIMVAEYGDLADEVRVEVHRFTNSLIDWLMKVLNLGPHELDRAELRMWASAIFAAVEGAQLVVRGCESVQMYDDMLKVYWAVGPFPSEMMRF